MTFLAILDHEKFRNVSSGIQSIAVTIAIIVGGIWTVITFDMLGQVDRARVELVHLNRELQEQAVPNIQIQAIQLFLPHDSAKYVHTIVTIENRGNKTATLAINEAPLQVTHVSIGANNQRIYGETFAPLPLPVPLLIDTTAKPAPGKVIYPYATEIRSGGKTVLNFLTRVSRSGLYWLAFNAPVSIEDQANLNGRSAKGVSSYWATGQLFVVH